MAPRPLPLQAMLQHSGSATKESSTHTASTRSLSLRSTTSRSILTTGGGTGGSDSEGSSAPPTSTPKHVSFAEDICKVEATVPCLDDISPDERWETWWCPHEYQAIRLAAKYDTKQMKKSSSESVDSVDQVFHKALHMGHAVTKAQFEEILRQPAHKNFPVNLDKWCCCQQPARGLEKYISEAQRKERADLVTHARTTVGKIQGAAEENDYTPAELEEEIALTYHQQSRHAILFAWVMGLADEEAAKEVYQELGRRNSLNTSGHGGARTQRRAPRRLSLQRALNRNNSADELDQVYRGGTSPSAEDSTPRDAPLRRMLRRNSSSDDVPKDILGKVSSAHNNSDSIPVRRLMRRNSSEGPKEGGVDRTHSSSGSKYRKNQLSVANLRGALASGHAAAGDRTMPKRNIYMQFGRRGSLQATPAIDTEDEEEKRNEMELRQQLANAPRPRVSRRASLHTSGVTPKRGVSRHSSLPSSGGNTLQDAFRKLPSTRSKNVFASASVQIQK